MSYELDEIGSKAFPEVQISQEIPDLAEEISQIAENGEVSLTQPAEDAAAYVEAAEVNHEIHQPGPQTCEAAGRTALRIKPPEFRDELHDATSEHRSETGRNIHPERDIESDTSSDTDEVEELDDSETDEADGVEGGDSGSGHPPENKTGFRGWDDEVPQNGTNYILADRIIYAVSKKAETTLADTDSTEDTADESAAEIKKTDEYVIRELPVKQAIPEPPPGSNIDWSPGRTDRTVAELEYLRDRENYNDVDLTMMSKAGDPDALAEFMNRNAPFIKMSANYLGWVDDPADIRQELELRMARTLIRDYDPDKGTKPLSFAGTNAIRDIINRQRDAQYPRSGYLVSAAKETLRVEKIIWSLENHLITTGGFIPMSEEYAAKLHIPEDRLRMPDEHDQTMGELRHIEASRAIDGYRPLTGQEIFAVLSNDKSQVSDYFFVSEERVHSALLHMALTEKMLSINEIISADESEMNEQTNIWSDTADLGERTTMFGEGEPENSETRFLREIEMNTVREVLPRALSTLAQRERDILRMVMVEEMTLEEIGKVLSRGDPDKVISYQRVQQIYKGILYEDAVGSARGAEFRRQLAEATGRELPNDAGVPSIKAINEVRVAMIARFPIMGNITRQVVTSVFALDGRLSSEQQSVLEISAELGYNHLLIRELIELELDKVCTTKYGQVVAGPDGVFEKFDYAPMREALFRYNPKDYPPLTEDELRAWGLL